MGKIGIVLLAGMLVMGFAGMACAADNAPIGALKGDANADGVVTSADVKLINQVAVGAAVLPEGSFWSADVNEDGIVNLLDAKLVQNWLEGGTTKDGKAVPLAWAPLSIVLLLGGAFLLAAYKRALN